MATLTDSDILDLVAGTQNDLGEPNFGQIAQNLQEYEVMPKWLKSDKVVVDSGIGIQRALMNKLPVNAAAHVGLGEVDDVDVTDLMTKINVPWRHAKTYWAFERRETLMNRGKRLVFNVIKPRRLGAMVALAEELETKAFASPSGTNEVDPYGIPWWITMAATTGFNGLAPTGHTTKGGINPTTETKWRNYTGTYSVVGKTDLIKTMRTGYKKCKWRSPVQQSDVRTFGDKYRIYTDEETSSDFDDVGESQNENLGRDVASMDGQTVFKRHPIVWIPQLDSTPVATNPVYMINHDTFYPVVLKGDFLRESEPSIKGDQHNVIVVYVDLTYNYICLDLRRNAGYYKV